MKLISPKFWAHVLPQDENGCWIWVGAKTVYGYGSWRAKDNKAYSPHRLLYEETYGSLVPGQILDHICHNKACINPDHLRICTNTENVRNQKLHKNNTSGFKGVVWSKEKKRWLAHIMVNRKTIYLGYFDSPEIAHAAYCEAAVKHFGVFANSGNGKVA